MAVKNIAVTDTLEALGANLTIWERFGTCQSFRFNRCNKFS